MHSETRFTAQTVFRSISRKIQKMTLSLLLIHGIILICFCYVSVISHCIQQVQSAV